ncbi:MAG: LysE family translocator [Pseudomonadota bacterium]
MTAADLFAYLVLLTTMTLAPGPLLAMTIARTLGRDVSGAVSFGFGVAIGNVVLIAAIWAGFGVWMASMPSFMDYAKFLGVAYLMYVAYDLWFKACDMESGSDKRSGGRGAAIAGMLSCFVSPHYMMLYMLLLPRLVDLSAVSNSLFSFLTVLTFAVLALCYGAVIYLADRCRSILVNPSKAQILNRVLAFVVAGCGVWMVGA